MHGVLCVCIFCVYNLFFADPSNVFTSNTDIQYMCVCICEPNALEMSMNIQFGLATRPF